MKGFMLMQPGVNVMSTEADAVGFDVRAYVRHSAGAVVGVIPDTTMDPVTASTLLYMGRRLGDTASWLSHVLVTPTHKEARITAFLTTWAYEQHWLGEALKTLAAERAPVIYAQRKHPKGSKWGALIEAVLANVYGHALTGTQMAERLIDSWLMDAMLARVQHRLGAGVSETITHVRTVMARQRVFLVEVATAELTRSRATRMLSRWRLSRRVFPIGGEREVRGSLKPVINDLFGIDTTWAGKLDAQVDQLPGLHGLRLLSKTARRLDRG